MAKDKMKNPYEEDIEMETFTISRRAMWWMVILFVLVCLNPPLWRNVYEATKPKKAWVPVVEIFRDHNTDEDRKEGKASVANHLKRYNTKLEDADFTKPPRRLMQEGITAVLHSGNRKTVIGKDGWLYFQPALNGLTGYGPVKPEPYSVANDPNKEPWVGPSEVIKKFARQLGAFGVELILVPIPVKPMIYPEHLSGHESDGPVTHPDASVFYDDLKAEPNVTLLDVADALWTLKASEQVFLKQDTHWTPEAMEFVAKLVASEVKQREWFAEAGADPSLYELLPPEERSAIGDLVEKLDVLPKIDGYVSQAGFDLESVRVQRVIDTRTDLAPVPDVGSKVVLLGDSFVNIYSMDGDLHWGRGAGFGEHFARELGLPVDVISINGEAATGVRKRLASRPNSMGMMKEKKVVVWAIAARDLFLSKTTAKATKVKWEDVEFNDKGTILKSKPVTKEGTMAAPDVVIVEGKMTMKSVIPDPKVVTYNDALFGAEYEVTGVIQQSKNPDAMVAVGDTINVLHWGFEGKQMRPESDYKVGETRELRLLDFNDKTELQTIQVANEADFALTVWFDEGKEKTPVDGYEDEVVKPGEEVKGSALVANLTCVIVSLLVIAGILRVSVGRKSEAR